MSSRVQISMSNFLRLTLFLPYFAFITCIVLTIFKDIEKSTRTHCKVSNFLPSISAITAGFEPQRFIWRVSFGLNSIIRYLIGYLQLQRLLNRHHIASREFYILIQKINSSIHFLELTFLLVLTYVSSNEIKLIHQCGFIGFMICSLLHMLCTILIDYYWPRTKTTCFNDREKFIRAKRLKWFIYNIISFFISLYFFFRHNFFCEPYIYSMYCFFEYFVILTNISYHSVIREEWDQEEGQIQFFY
ncbi:unnamed protein product [Adineta steineri]|uniref:CWH43-like N-terminal domain-containing protein n=1 Tax=Adineta steineri TaxID=433720 RepID=A0A814VZB7_9BILA|nr:unnamed protein product [Adineta steineri]